MAPGEGRSGIGIIPGIGRGDLREPGAPGSGCSYQQRSCWDWDAAEMGTVLLPGSDWMGMLQGWRHSWDGGSLESDPPGMRLLLRWARGWCWDEAGARMGLVLQWGRCWDWDSAGMKKRQAGNRALRAAPLQRGCADPGKSLPGGAREMLREDPGEMFLEDFGEIQEDREERIREIQEDRERGSGGDAPGGLREDGPGGSRGNAPGGSRRIGGGCSGSIRGKCSGRISGEMLQDDPGGLGGIMLREDPREMPREDFGEMLQEDAPGGSRRMQGCGTGE